MSSAVRSSFLAPTLGILVGAVIAFAFIQTQTNQAPVLRGDVSPDNLPSGPAAPGAECRFTVSCDSNADSGGVTQFGNCLCPNKDADGNCLNNDISYCQLFHTVECVEGETCAPAMDGMRCTTVTVPKDCGLWKNEAQCSSDLATGCDPDRDETCQFLSHGPGSPTCACVGPVSNYGPVDDWASCLKPIPCQTDKQCDDAGLGTCVLNPTFNGVTEIGYFCTERDELECKHDWAHCVDNSSGGKSCKPDAICGNASKEAGEDCDPGGICIDGTAGGETINGSQAYARCVDGGGGVSIIATNTCTEECKSVASSSSSAAPKDWCCMDGTYECRPIGGAPVPNF
jgi:hypothetical protein